MELLPRNLYEAQLNFTTVYNNCTIASCSVYCATCVDHSSSPAPSPITAGRTNHAIIPYLVSATCVLGLAFLLLTTCVILLRHRCTRRRSSVRVPSTSRDSEEDHGPVDHPVWHIVTAGLPQSVIDSISSVSYKSCDRLIHDSDCSVCLTKFEDGDGVRLLPQCSHAFHVPCIDTWLRSHKNCPLCRAPVVALNPNSSPSGSARIESFENALVVAVDDDGTLSVEDARIALNDGFQAVRRSISLDSAAAFAGTNSVVIDTGLQDGEGSCAKVKIVEEADKEGHGDSGISRMMKRSLSSSAKMLSPFRSSKSQASSSTLAL